MKIPEIKFLYLLPFILLLPLLSYTTFQLIEQDKDEAMVQHIYQRELESILFSVNQYTWDKFQTWNTRLSTIYKTAHTPEESREMIRQYLYSQKVLKGFFLNHDDETACICWQESSPESAEQMKNQFTQNKIREIFKDKHNEIVTMQKLGRSGYARPINVNWDTSLVLLIYPFSLEENVSSGMLAGLILDVRQFIEEVVSGKVASVNENNLVIGIRRESDNRLLYITPSAEPPRFETRERLWYLDNLTLEVGLSGTSVQQLTHKRRNTHLFMLLLVNVLFIIGLIAMLRTVSKEIHLAKMKNDFVANVSHELRTPLALIHLYAETLLIGRVQHEDKREKYYSTIVNESSRLTQLINNLLDFSKIESRPKTYRLEPTQLDELVHEALTGYQSYLEQTECQVELDCDAISQTIDLDRVAVRRALINLMDNAIKYSKDKKWMRICLKETENFLILSVQDHGIGIEKTEQKKIFNKFYRVGSSLIHDTKGSGLGLSLVKQIMAIHHGKVKVESKPNEGSIFSLIFPKVSMKGSVR